MSSHNSNAGQGFPQKNIVVRSNIIETAGVAPVAITKGILADAFLIVYLLKLYNRRRPRGSVRL